MEMFEQENDMYPTEFVVTITVAWLVIVSREIRVHRRNSVAWTTLLCLHHLPM